MKVKDLIAHLKTCPEEGEASLNVDEHGFIYMYVSGGSYKEVSEWGFVSSYINVNRK